MTLYPQAHYEVWLDTPGGERLHLLDSFRSLSYARKLNTVGRWSLQVAADRVPSQFVKDSALVELWRTIPGRPAGLLMAGPVSTIDYSDQRGVDVLALLGEDGMGILERRIVAYDAASDEASKTDYADDMMKAIVRENLGALATDSTRDLSDYGVSVASDVSLGPSLTYEFARQNVFEVLRGIGQAAKSDGTPVYFDMVPRVLGSTAIGWRFETAITQLGVDRTYASGVPTVFGREWGNLDAPRLTYDYTTEVSVMYAGGQGQASYMDVFKSIRSKALRRWVLAHREAFIHIVNQRTQAGLQTAAKRVLEEHQATVTFTAVLKDTPQSRFGIDWDYGDKVVAVYRDIQVEGLVDAVEISLDENGTETIAAQIEVEQ